MTGPPVPLRFSRVRRTATYLSPSPDGGTVSLEVELRRDPLTHRTGRLAHFQGFRLARVDLAEVVAASRVACPFCPERVETVTPRLAPEVAPEGRIAEGEALLFPNISPYDRRSAVVALSRQHFIAPEDIPARLVLDGLIAARRYLSAPGVLRRGDYGLVTWNYMPPAGATLVHPHLQVFATDRPGSLPEQEVRASRRYLGRVGRSYWSDLIDSERRLGERWIAAGRHTAWVAAFVSRSVISDLLVVFPGCRTLTELGAPELEEFALGLESALKALSRQGVVSFNLAVYPAPAGASGNAVELHVRLSPRIHFNPAIGGSDCTVWQQLLDEPFMVRSPEDLAASLRGELNLALGDLD